MRKSLIITVLFQLLLVSNSKAGDKDWVIGAGVQTAFITQKTTKLVIDRYNETRPWLDKKMGYLRPASGLAFSFGWDAGVWALELGWNRYRATSSAKGIAPGTGIEASRDLRIKSTSVYFINHVDIASIYEDYPDFSYGVSLGLNFGGGKYQTRINNAPFEDIKNTGFNNLGTYFGLFYEKPLLGGDTEEGLCLRVAPFVHGILGIEPKNVQGLKDELDPVNANVPLPDNATLNFHRHFGFNVKLVYRIDR